MIFKKKIRRNRLYKEYVTLFNGFHKLSERELDVFAVFVKLDYNQRTEYHSFEGKDYDLVSKENRRLIISETLINKANLSRYIKSLKKTNALVSDNGINWRVNDNIMRPLFFDSKTVSLIFTFEIDE
jgi:hypothetical protein